MDAMEPTDPPGAVKPDPPGAGTAPRPSGGRPWLLPLVLGGLTLTFALGVSVAIGVTVVLPWVFGGLGGDGDGSGSSGNDATATEGAPDGAHRWVGLWQASTKLPGLDGPGVQPVNLVMHVTPDRFFSVAVREQQDLDLDGLPDPFVLGVIEAAGGEWSTRTMRGPAGAGTYRFADGGEGMALHVIDTQKHETIWQPLNAAELPAKFAGPRPIAPPDVDPRSAPVLPYLALGRVIARAWQADAELIRVQVRTPSASGRLNLVEHPAASLSMTFYSPGVMETYSVTTVGAKLHAQRLGPGVPHETTPIPDAVLELDAAMELAQAASGQVGVWSKAELEAHRSDDGPTVAWRLVPGQNMRVEHVPADIDWTQVIVGDDNGIRMGVVDGELAPLLGEPLNTKADDRPTRPRAVLIDAVTGNTVSTAQLEQQYIDDYNDLAARANASLRALFRSRSRASSGSIDYDFSSSSSSYEDSNDSGSGYGDPTNGALQRAWEAGDMRAYDRIAGGTGSGSDRSRYGY